MPPVPPADQHEFLALGSAIAAGLLGAWRFLVRQRRWRATNNHRVRPVAATPLAVPMRVLIAEDQAIFRNALLALLQRSGAAVVGEATTGAEAVTLALELRPDVVLMDVRMPDLDGIAATRQIVAKWPAAKVVVLSGRDEPEQIIEALRAGAVDYLSKDDALERLMATLNKAVAG